MAEMIKNEGNVKNVDDIKSRVQSTVGQMQEKVSGVAHDVVETFESNKTLAYVGIGLLVIGAGVGIWALLRGRRSEAESEFYGRDEFRRSSQY